MRAPPPPESAGYDVVGIGEISVDDVVCVAERPAWGRKSRARERQQLGGGQVATAMVALQRLGLRTALIGVVGGDEAGRFAVEGLRAEGVDTRGVRVVEARTRTAVILVDDAGERTVIADEDPRLHLDLDTGLAQLASAGRVLHFDGSHRQGAERAARSARAAGRVVSCDLEFHPGEHEALLEMTDLCILAASGAAAAVAPTAAPAVDGRPDVEPASRKAVQLPAVAPGGIVCLTLGERGAVAFPGGGAAPIVQAAFAVTPVVDTTACGDTFRAGFLAAYLDGNDLAGCLRFACAAAALKVRAPGRRGCPRRDAVEALLAEAA